MNLATLAAEISATLGGVSRIVDCDRIAAAILDTHPQLRDAELWQLHATVSPDELDDLVQADPAVNGDAGRLIRSRLGDLTDQIRPLDVRVGDVLLVTRTASGLTAWQRPHRPDLPARVLAITPSATGGPTFHTDLGDVRVWPSRHCVVSSLAGTELPAAA